MSKKDLTSTDGDTPALGNTMKIIADALDKQGAKSPIHSQPSERATESRAPRSSREGDLREASATPLTWKPADSLPDPPQKDGFVHHWVRGSSRGEIDSVNMAKAMREGWRPCEAADYPEITVAMYNRGESTNTIEFGGLILCRMPVEVAAARTDYYTKLAMRQISSVNTRLREEEQGESRVKYANESNSIVNNLSPRQGR